MPNPGTEQSEARLIEHLVGSVLSSIVKAQGLAASQLVEMIDQVGFEPAVGGQPRKVRTFSFDFFRTELDTAKQELVRRRVTASVPLLTLVNLPSIAIHEAKVQMDLRLVAHQQEEVPVTTRGGSLVAGTAPLPPLRLFAVPARKQLVRTASEAFAIDAAGTIKIEMTLRQESPLGLDKIQSLLDGGSDESTAPPSPTPGPAEPPEEEPSPTDATGTSTPPASEATEAPPSTAATRTRAATRARAARKRKDG